MDGSSRIASTVHDSVQATYHAHRVEYLRSLCADWSRQSFSGPVAQCLPHLDRAIVAAEQLPCRDWIVSLHLRGAMSLIQLGVDMDSSRFGDELRFALLEFANPVGNHESRETAPAAG